MTGWITAKTVVEENNVAAKRDEACLKFPRFSQLWHGIVWLLSRVGEQLGVHKVIGGVEYRLHVVASRANDLPEVTLLYTVEKNNVIIHEIGIEIGKQAEEPKSIAEIR